MPSRTVNFNIVRCTVTSVGVTKQLRNIPSSIPLGIAQNDYTQCYASHKCHHIVDKVRVHRYRHSANSKPKSISNLAAKILMLLVWNDATVENIVITTFGILSTKAGVQYSCTYRGCTVVMG